MENKGSFLYSQKPAICPCPKPARSRPCPQTASLTYILILSSNLRLGLPSGLFPSRFPTKILLSPILAACPAHLSSLFDHTSNIWWGVERISSLSCSLLHSPVISSLPGPNTLLRTLFSNNLSLRAGVQTKMWRCRNIFNGRLRLRIFSTFGIMKVVMSSPLRAGRLYPQEFPGTHFRGWATPGHMVPSVATEKIPSDTTADRSRDPPTVSAVP